VQEVIRITSELTKQSLAYFLFHAASHEDETI